MEIFSYFESRSNAATKPSSVNIKKKVRKYGNYLKKFCKK